MNKLSLVLVSLLLGPAMAVASYAEDIQMELGLLSQSNTICMDTQPVSTLSMKICSGEYAEQLDFILNREYQKIMKIFTNTDYDKEIKNRFRQSQRDWLTFRASNCSWSSSQMLGGTGEGLLYGSCENLMTDKRIQEMVNHFYFD